MQLSDKVLNMNESATLKMARMSNELKASGVDVINMSLGEPDFDTPDFIKDAAKLALDQNITRYSPVPGFLETRKAICHKLKRDNNLDYKPEQIVISTGAKQTIANIILATINPGDEVIIPGPYWVSYKEIIQFAGGIPVEIFSSVEDNFKITTEKLKNKISNKTKMFLFSNPCNPSGTLYSKNELAGLSDVLATNKNILVVSDEIYEYISFDEFTTMGEFPAIADQLVIVNGVSKGYAMTGWRLGYMAGPKEIAAACTKIQSQFTSGTSSITQKAAEAALNADPSFMNEMRAVFETRRNLIYEKLLTIKNLKTNKPTGAFYIFPDVGAFVGKKYKGQVIADTNAMCEYLLADFHIGLTPGDAFGNPNNIRLSYAISEKNIIEAVDRLKRGLEALT